VIPDQRRRKRSGLWAAVSSAALALALTLAGGAMAPAATAADGPGGPSLVKPHATRAKTAPDKELRRRIVAAAEREAGRTAPSGDKRTGTEGPKATPFIIGGTETVISSAPWMVQLSRHARGGPAAAPPV
jgi:hypothetical protein